MGAFFQEKVAQAWDFSGKNLEKMLFLQGLFGGFVCFLREKNIICLKLCKPGLNQSSSGKSATTLDNTVVRKETGSCQHWLLLFQKKSVTENYH